MAIANLPVNFKDDIIDTSINNKRRYNIEDNSDGTKSLEDVTAYEQVGSYFGAEQINQTNGTVNKLIELSQENKMAVDNIQKEMGKTLSTDKDFILINQSIISFTDNEAIISDNRITEYSLADVYFTKDTFDTAEKALITVETYDKKVILSAGRTPEGAIKATIHIRVV